jgi:hypothetical protein
MSKNKRWNNPENGGLEQAAEYLRRFGHSVSATLKEVRLTSQIGLKQCGAVDYLRANKWHVIA